MSTIKSEIDRANYTRESVKLSGKCIITQKKIIKSILNVLETDAKYKDLLIDHPEVQEAFDDNKKALELLRVQKSLT